MTITKYFKTVLAVVIIAAFAALSVSHVSAAQIDYNNPNNQAITKPRFNPYTNVPAGIGNEADFVKLRKSNGDPTVPAAQSNFIDPVDATCAVGEKFDIRTYVHNGANTEYNNNGSGQGVARNVVVSMQAPLNKVSKQFTFSSRINASNAATVTDSGKLNCGNDVQLKLVPKSVRVYSKFYGWKNASDSAVNGSLKTGSRVVGSGDVWGCWEDTVVVVYVVEVVKKPQVVSKASCDALALTVLDNRRVRARITASTQNATILGYRIDWGDNNTSNSQEGEHTYAEAGEYTITGSVRVRLADGTEKWVSGYGCEKQVTFKDDVENCPLPGKEHLPVDSPECKEDEKEEEVTEPQVLPATGPAELIGMFAATSVAGTIAYNLVYRRFNN